MAEQREKQQQCLLTQPFKPHGAVEKTRGSRQLANQAEQRQWPQLQAGGHSKPASQA